MAGRAERQLLLSKVVGSRLFCTRSVALNPECKSKKKRKKVFYCESIYESRK